MAGENELTLEQQIQAHNEAIDAAPEPLLTAEEPEETIIPAADETADETGKDDIATSGEDEEKGGDGTAEEDLAAPPETDKPAETALETKGEETVAGTYRFTPDMSREEFSATKEKYFQEYEVTPELASILDYYEQALSKAAPSSLAEAAAAGGAALAQPDAAVVFEPYGGQPRVEKVMNALDRLAETDVTGAIGAEEAVNNARPLVELLKTDFSREFSAIASEILMSDSMKYQGASVFQEAIMDTFRAGPEKFVNIWNYLVHQTPLPTTAAASSLPSGIEDSLADAFWQLPERKRFEIESWAKEIAQIEKDLPTMDKYYADEAKVKLSELSDKLSDEIVTLRKVQAGIDSTRTNEQTTARQQAQEAAAFTTELLGEYYGEVFTMSQQFADMIAPQLHFLDEKMRGFAAQNIVAHISSALTFLYDEEFNFVPDPTAAHYAEQLKKSGITFDFKAGSELLHKHLLACRKVKVLKRTNASPASIDKAERDKKAILKDIKAAQTELIGQITARFVKSAGNALQEKVTSAGQKKQAVRKIVNDQGGGGKTSDSIDRIRDEIKAHNARVEREEAESGYDSILFGREDAASAGR